MNICIRVDGGGEYGLGHVSRMVTLGAHLQTFDRNVAITIATSTPTCLPLRDACLDRDWTLNATGGQYPPETDVLIVDHPYQNDDALCACCDRMAVVRIDAPWADPDSANLLIQPDMHTHVDDWPQLAGWGPRLLLGADYVLLRPEVTTLPVFAWQDRTPGITVTAGGSDPDGTLRRLLTVLAQVPQVPQTFLVPDAWQGDAPMSLLPHQSLQPFSLDRLRRAALLLTTMGVTVYEALYLGIPVTVLPRTPEQDRCLQRLVEATEGAVVPGPRVTDLADPWAFCQSLEEQAHSWQWLQARQACARGWVDGRGAQRVAAAIMTLVSGRA